MAMQRISEMIGGCLFLIPTTPITTQMMKRQKVSVSTQLAKYVMKTFLTIVLTYSMLSQSCLTHNVATQLAAIYVVHHYVTEFAKRCIIHASDFVILKSHNFFYK